MAAAIAPTNSKRRIRIDRIIAIPPISAIVAPVIGRVARACISSARCNDSNTESAGMGIRIQEGTSENR